MCLHVVEWTVCEWSIVLCVSVRKVDVLFG